MIIYFSGTGNSRAVATLLAECMGEESPRPMEPSMRSGDVTLEADSRIVWVFPVYSWGVPPYVLDIIKGVMVSGKPVHHCVMTCGDDCGLADRMWRKAVTSRGWQAGSVMSVQMPNNYVAMKGFDVDPEEVEIKKLKAFPERVSQVAARILEDERTGTWHTDIVKGKFAWIKTRIIYPWFIRHAMNPAEFRVDRSACTGCGKCQRTCPTGNIRLVATDSTTHHRIPSWGKDCAGCLGCYHICPEHAVSFGGKTAGKGQYYFKPVR